MDEQTLALRAAFNDYDYFLKRMLAESNKIKQLAPAYWAAQGYTVQPRLEKLRQSVFADVAER